MALKFGFFNSLNGDRKYSAEDIGRYLQGLITSGVYADNSDSLQVFVDGGLTVAVQPGRAMLDFHYMENDAVLYLSLAAGGALPRYDAIIAKLDRANRAITIEVKQGTAASTPEKPAMERNETVKEYCLAYIYVGKLATSISQANITDTRPDTSVCGWVTGVIHQVPTGTLYKQWETAYNEEYERQQAFAAEKQREYNEWYAGLTLDPDAMLPVPSKDKVFYPILVNAEGTAYMLRRTVPNADIANKVNGFWFDFIDADGNETDELQIHWFADEETGRPIITPNTGDSDGYTPVKGVDYFTDEDKAEIVAEVLASIPNASGVEF